MEQEEAQDGKEKAAVPPSSKKPDEIVEKQISVRIENLAGEAIVDADLEADFFFYKLYDLAVNWVG